MNVRIIAKIELPVYVAQKEDGGCFVFSLDDTSQVELGDVLSGDFEAPGQLHFTVENTTRGRPVHVYLEDWGFDRDQALQRLRRIGASSKVWTV